MIKKNTRKSDLEIQMLNESNIIIESIDFLEKIINKKGTDFEKYLFENNFKQASIIEKEVLILLKKLSLEEENMDKFLIKYRNKINEEKAKILHNSK